MKYFIHCCLFALLLAHSTPGYAGKHRYTGLPRTEVELMNSVLNCLKYKDTFSYYNLFPPFDTLWHMVLHNADHTPEVVQELNALKEHPQSLIDFDPQYNKEIVGRFCAILQKGEDSGIHWNSIVLQRYELQKEGLTQNLIGYEKISPERFSGYIFVRDLLGRSTFCITITEIQKINGFFFGGQVYNILEASTIDEFKAREYDEQKYYAKLALDAVADTVKKEPKDSTDIADSGDPPTPKKTSPHKDTLAAQSTLIIVDSSDDDKPKTRKEVVDRKYYEGKFDDEIPVKLFIRYMKDPGTGKVAFWDGLYKFGDQVNYVKLNITKNSEGHWIMEDDPPVGSMDLELKSKEYTGSWTNNENQTGYDVVLTQKDLPPRKVEELDNILEKGLSGSANQKSTQEKEKKPKVEEDKGFDPNDN